jgi:hypothetical protein
MLAGRAAARAGRPSRASLLRSWIGWARWPSSASRSSASRPSRPRAATASPAPFPPRRFLRTSATGRCQPGGSTACGVLSRWRDSSSPSGTRMPSCALAWASPSSAPWRPSPSAGDGTWCVPRMGRSAEGCCSCSRTNLSPNLMSPPQTLVGFLDYYVLRSFILAFHVLQPPGFVPSAFASDYLFRMQPFYDTVIVAGLVFASGVRMELPCTACKPRKCICEALRSPRVTPQVRIGLAAEVTTTVWHFAATLICYQRFAAHMPAGAYSLPRRLATLSVVAVAIKLYFTRFSKRAGRGEAGRSGAAAGASGECPAPLRGTAHPCRRGFSTLSNMAVGAATVMDAAHHTAEGAGLAAPGQPPAQPATGGLHWRPYRSPLGRGLLRVKVCACMGVARAALLPKAGHGLMPRTEPMLHGPRAGSLARAGPPCHRVLPADRRGRGPAQRDANVRQCAARLPRGLRGPCFGQRPGRCGDPDQGCGSCGGLRVWRRAGRKGLAQMVSLQARAGSPSTYPKRSQPAACFPARTLPRT